LALLFYRLPAYLKLKTNGESFSISIRVRGQGLKNGEQRQLRVADPFRTLPQRVQALLLRQGGYGVTGEAFEPFKGLKGEVFQTYALDLAPL
jgi:hypothetical protein